MIGDLFCDISQVIAIKEDILRKARRVKPKGLFISEDLSPETLAKREPYVAALKEAKKAGKVAYFVLDRLVIRDRSNTFL